MCRYYFHDRTFNTKYNNNKQKNNILILIFVLFFNIFLYFFFVNSKEHEKKTHTYISRKQKYTDVQIEIRQNVFDIIYTHTKYDSRRTCATKQQLSTESVKCLFRSFQTQKYRNENVDSAKHTLTQFTLCLCLSGRPVCTVSAYSIHTLFRADREQNRQRSIVHDMVLCVSQFCAIFGCMFSSMDGWMFSVRTASNTENFPLFLCNIHIYGVKKALFFFFFYQPYAFLTTTTKTSI